MEFGLIIRRLMASPAGTKVLATVPADGRSRVCHVPVRKQLTCGDFKLASSEGRGAPGGAPRLDWFFSDPYYFACKDST